MEVSSHIKRLNFGQLPKTSGLLGPKFAGGALSDDELRAYAATAGQPSVDVSVLRKLLTHGRAESFRLAVPTEANGDWVKQQLRSDQGPLVICCI